MHRRLFIFSLEYRVLSVWLNQMENYFLLGSVLALLVSDEHIFSESNAIKQRTNERTAKKKMKNRETPQNRGTFTSIDGA